VTSIPAHGPLTLPHHRQRVRARMQMISQPAVFIRVRAASMLAAVSPSCKPGVVTSWPVARKRAAASACRSPQAEWNITTCAIRSLSRAGASQLHVLIEMAGSCAHSGMPGLLWLPGFVQMAAPPLPYRDRLA
jgi:hypothetical protein